MFLKHFSYIFLFSPEYFSIKTMFSFHPCRSSIERNDWSQDPSKMNPEKCLSLSHALVSMGTKVGNLHAEVFDYFIFNPDPLFFIKNCTVRVKIFEEKYLLSYLNERYDTLIILSASQLA